MAETLGRYGPDGAVGPLRTPVATRTGVEFVNLTSVHFVQKPL